MRISRNLSSAQRRRQNPSRPKQNCLRRIALALTLVMLSLTLPWVGSPAHAGQIFSSSSTAHEIPQLTYRNDLRPPDVIFAEGFRCAGSCTNSNLFTHVDEPVQNETSWVSTTESPQVALMFGSASLISRPDISPTRWVYEIVPDGNFTSVNYTLSNAIHAWGTSDEAYRAQLMLSLYGDEEEWAALADASGVAVPTDRIRSAAPVMLSSLTGRPILAEGFRVHNPHFPAHHPPQAAVNPQPWDPAVLRDHVLA